MALSFKMLPNTFNNKRYNTNLFGKPQIVPRGVEVAFDFKVIANSVSQGIEWGEYAQAFEPTEGKVMFTSVVRLPLGAIIEEDSTEGDNIVFESITEGKGADLAGIQVGDTLRAITALADLKGKKQGAVYVLDSRNPRLFPETMNAITSNAVANGGSGKAILVFERDASKAAAAAAAYDEEEQDEAASTAASASVSTDVATFAGGAEEK